MVSAAPAHGLTRGRGWAEYGFSFGRLEAFKAMKSRQAQCQLVSTCFPVSTSAAEVPLWPAAQGLQTHTTALFTSTPLLLCEEVMGYSATPVPFSSFLRGFLGAGAAVGRQGKGRQGYPLVIDAWRGVYHPPSFPARLCSRSASLGC